MNINLFLIQIIICAFFAYTTEQTFQYSIGWGAGKRSMIKSTNFDIFLNAMDKKIFDKFLWNYLQLPADPRLISILNDAFDSENSFKSDPLYYDKFYKEIIPEVIKLIYD